MRSLTALIIGAALMLSASTAVACGRANTVAFACGRADTGVSACGRVNTVLFVGTGDGVRPTVKLVAMDDAPVLPACSQQHDENIGDKPYDR